MRIHFEATSDGGFSTETAFNGEAANDAAQPGVTIASTLPANRLAKIAPIAKTHPSALTPAARREAAAKRLTKSIEDAKARAEKLRKEAKERAEATRLHLEKLKQEAEAFAKL